MSAIIDENGIQIETFSEIFTYLQTQYKNIYGQDINLDQDTADGQQLAILTKLIRDLQENNVDIYNAFDPDTAQGTQLIRLLKLCGIVRSAATKSSVDVAITTDREVILSDTYTITDTLGQNWIISIGQTLPIGTSAVSFLAEEWGSIEALAGTITEQNTIVLGVTNLTNPSDAIAGRDEQTDTSLKLQRDKSVSLPSQNTISGLEAKLLNISGVVDAVVKENKTLTYDATLDLNAKTIWAIVDGGAVEDITTVMSVDRGSGVALKGDEVYNYTTQQERNDGTFRIYTDEIKFDRPTNTDMYIKFDVTLKAGQTSFDEDAIKRELIKKLYNIGENATVTELYSFIYQGGSTFIATNLTISDDDITYVTDKLVADADEKFIIDEANITITEV